MESFIICQNNNSQYHVDCGVTLYALWFLPVKIIIIPNNLATSVTSYALWRVGVSKVAADYSFKLKTMSEDFL